MTTPTNTDLASVSGVSKSFNHNLVVDNISFSLRPGEIFGLIGPNGAGKTTTIRMMMDIIRPDSGQIFILGKNFNELAKNKIGYLPEERGLYRKLTVIDTIIYLASLKGIKHSTASSRAEELLNLVNMLPHKNKKIEELSRGMGQLIQFLVTIIHDPQLVILDEPFAGLDPVNASLLKNIISKLREQNKTVILSTHRMNEVEELCDRILMINKGCSVLYGKLAEIKLRYRSNSIILGFDGQLPKLNGVKSIHEYKNHVELFLEEDSSPDKILAQIIKEKVSIYRFEVATPSLNEIFIQVAGEK
ncbi:MAG: ATP-binding cassette domain-containing protein [Dehalococcoidia bacterium]|nr:MAG: ATP-binding cassette domain-containing protein [Dehalococcoidia bacterium]